MLLVLNRKVAKDVAISCVIVIVALLASSAHAATEGRKFVPLVRSDKMLPLSKGIALSDRKSAEPRTFIPLSSARSGGSSKMMALNGGSGAKSNFIALRETPRSEKPKVSDEVKLAMLLGPEKGFDKEGKPKTVDNREMIAVALAPVMDQRAQKQLITKEPVAGQAAPLIADSLLREVDEKVLANLPAAVPVTLHAALPQTVPQLENAADGEYESNDLTEEDLGTDLDMPDAALLGVKEEDALDKELVKAAKAKSKGFVWPVAGDDYTRISSAFGIRRHPVTGKQGFHAGIDIPAPIGTPVLAALDGEVTGVGTHKNLGRFVKITHADGTYALYGHLSKQSVKMGMKVASGRRIGTVGSTGRSTGPHLDFSIRKEGKPINPMPLLADALKEKKLALAD
ncbi:MAG: M23 family metallopeptidase [Alphaproteobacteria bacterium]|nr:M23 family metallopeptidase [Alphaproteobacteria bacterium]